MATLTNPLGANGGAMSAQQAAAPGRVTTPAGAGFAAGAPAGDAIAAVQSGIATQYWNECLPLPAGNPETLWFFVDGTWCAHVNPSASTKDLVQRAFLGTGSTVRVWYDGGTVAGLVVSG
jgi:hypothetical protein